MGGGEWKKAKSRAKKAAEDMADELVSLYAKRQSMKGFAYPADTVWQKDFENNFEYIETEEQLRAAEEIKEDMEKESPMDRLVCGDVGYGKTEVALRSAFKAIDNSKQVAILVPTTVLAQQHYNAIVKRFEGFPIKVEMLSRFRTQAQQRKILKDLKYGQVDIVVGTHKLLSDKIKYYDLGLLIIDEEQRFGVRHKEKIKQMKNEIDVLTLTATPIPRTLHMSMVGVKDISLIEEPPPGRIPVQTYVLEYNPYIIKEAIEKEISRGGQVFYVHNKVMGIEKLKDQITSMIPGARVVIAHGQMPERQLEKVMVSFLEHEYDVLIATTIIESGLDVANANTMIIDHADQFGLSQLHQLRGRVGRSSKQAYVYMTYQKNKILSEIASKRLKAVKEFTEFGAGFKIAMKDLEIRGAGNLLSSAQHGHLSDVGYELFCRMIEEAIKEKKGEPVVHREQINLKMNVNAYIPEKYISEEKSRYEVYRKIAMITDEKECQQLTEELIDRYGDIPVPVIRLMDMGFIKNLGQKTGIIKLVQKEKMISLFFSKRVSLDLMTSQDVFKRHSVKLNVKNTQNIQLDIPIRYNKEQDMVKKIIKILSDLGKNPIGQFTEEYKEENNV
jgi:transcription-repair coupling factor (superfamily II helicase)